VSEDDALASGFWLLASGFALLSTKRCPLPVAFTFELTATILRPGTLLLKSCQRSLDRPRADR